MPATQERVPVVLGVRVELELERRLDQLTQQLGKARSPCIREAISQVLSRHGVVAVACRQSERMGQLKAPRSSEQVPDWTA